MKALKDYLFNEKSLTRFATAIKEAYSEFDTQGFVKKSLKAFPSLELKQRISRMTSCLNDFLPKDYKKAVEILIQSIPKESNSHTENFVFVVYSEYVALYGATSRDLQTSLHALGEFTICFSAEGAIRVFINNFQEDTFLYMDKWVRSENVHQRRLVSEGLRPQLPWYSKIHIDYKRAASYLDKLYYDKDRYVTRSVANHLNDISKFDTPFVLETLFRWKQSKKQTDKEMSYIISHALRTSIKRGDRETLHFLGYSDVPQITVDKLKALPKKINLGERIEFSFELTAHKDELLVVDYEIEYCTPHKRGAKKVFKLKNITVKKGQRIVLRKKHLFRAMTTKKLYSGKHHIRVKINGLSSSKWTTPFMILVEDSF